MLKKIALASCLFFLNLEENDYERIVFLKEIPTLEKSNGKYDVASSKSIQFREKGFAFLLQSVSTEIILAKSLSQTTKLFWLNKSTLLKYGKKYLFCRYG